MASPNFVNRTLWTGDNLDILRGMNSECVDLIYLDPPFNSNQSYAAPVGSKAAGSAFKDTWTLSDLDVACMGLIADEKPEIAYLLDAASRTHGKGMQSYLTMMAVRLLEMRRVLKSTGSIYLHCDPTASHYLKLLLDAVFGHTNFRNEIVWRRTGTHGKANRFAPIHDTILFYSRADSYRWNHTKRPYMKHHVEQFFVKVDKGWQTNYYGNVLTGSGTRNGESGEPWKGFDPTAKGRHWAIPRRLLDEVPEDLTGLAQHQKLDRLFELGLIVIREGHSWPIYEHTITPDDGQLIPDLWAFQPYTEGMVFGKEGGIDADVRWLSTTDVERIGYPTQKPLALLERIIKASSNEGDVVLDPFCGCATACVAAEKLGRQWVGIDLSPKAAELVNIRLRSEMGDLFHHGFVTTRTDILRRTDIDAPIPYRQNKHVLYGQQEGQCAGCRMDFPFKVFEVDHVIPQSRGGSDHLDNLQLLCSHCNRTKGDRPQEYLVAKLKEIAL